MRPFFVLFFFAIAALPNAAFANTVDSGSTNNPVRIESDQANGTITFFIDDKPAVQINRDGLYIVESIVYGTVIVDTGPAYVQKLITPESAEKGGRDE